MRRLGFLAGATLVFGLGVFWVLTQPRYLAAENVPRQEGNPKAGRLVFFAGGCGSCHATPGQDDPTILGGGHELKTPFGTFLVPNISSDPDAGIGGWSLAMFANAMMRGVSPDGRHYYPAFPYTSYQRMTPVDIADVKAFLDTLPAVGEPAAAHRVGFPFNIRRGLGLWKHLYLDGRSFEPDPDADALTNRGAYLVMALAHCGECHTPRNLIGGPRGSRQLAGGPNPEGEGRIPNITPHADGIGSWSAKDIVYSLESGFTPEFDSFGGSMKAVQKNMAKLPAADRAAIAAYLKSVPAVPSR